MKSERVYTVVEIARRLPCNMQHESGCKVRLSLRPVQGNGQMLTWELDEAEADGLDLGDRVTLTLATTPCSSTAESDQRSQSPQNLRW